MRFLISAALTMLLIGLAAGVQGEEDSAPEAVDVFHSFLSAFSRSDVDGIVNVFSEDAIFWGTGSEELVEDIDGIRAYFSFLSESPPGQLKARALSLSSLELSSNNALVSGIWELMPKGQNIGTPLRVSMAMSLQDGIWKIVQFHNSAMPEPGN